MKLRHALLLTIAALAAAGTACHHEKRSDWRSPSRPIPCATDADCHGGTCGLDPGATQGTCSGTGVIPLLPASDGGVEPGQGPGPSVQPSPNDIQI